MSKANGSKPIQRLAAALRPPQDELAAALQDCLDSAAQTAARAAAQEVKNDARAAGRAAAQEVKDELIPRLDKQDATLRLFWKQFGGDENKRLPIDD